MTTIRRVLVSVSNKHGLADFIRVLASKGAEILSTGGTAKVLREAGIAVTDVSTYTGSPEIMDGRVKTLHPRVHGGILMRELDEDRTALASIGGAPIDLVVVNLYPFEETLRRSGRLARRPRREDRHRRPGDGARRRPRTTRASRWWSTRRTTRRCRRRSRPTGSSPTPRAVALAAKAFSHTAAYDGAIAGYLSSLADDGGRERFPRSLHLGFERAYSLRYGENPHQQALSTGSEGPSRAPSAAPRASGPAGRSCRSTTSSTSTRRSRRCVSTTCPAVVVKHCNPCGVAVGATLVEAYRAAREADPVSGLRGHRGAQPSGRRGDGAGAGETFLEAVAAPGFDDDGAGAPAHAEEPPAALDVGRARAGLRSLRGC
jgi:phosphoribosylaminoimidazolecarboxamide formyltransferase/IMP cyclohydrolase